MKQLQLVRGTWLAALLGLAMAMPALPALAQQVEWKMHLVWVPAREEVAGYQKFADLVNQRSQGKLKITVYPGGSLGVKDVDMLRVLPAGNVIQAAGLYPGYVTRDVPEFAVTMPAGEIKDAKELAKALPALTKIYNETYDRFGVKLLGYVMSGDREGHIFCKEPLNSYAQLKSKKLRVWDKFHVQTFTALGVSAQIVGQNDLYLALQTGVVDCAVYTIGFANTISLHEVAPHSAYLFPYLVQPLGIVVSKKAYEALSPEVQKIMQNAADEVQKETVAAYLRGEFEKRVAALFKQKGGKQGAPFSAADQAAFQKAEHDSWVRGAKEIGNKPFINREAILKAIGG